MIDAYAFLRPLLFSLPPEFAHSIALRGLDLAYQLGSFSSPVADEFKPIALMGLQFPNRLGLAAGLDKNAMHVDALGALGFGFIEVGTVTPRPQPGNPRPRLVRLINDRALVNRMGFPNAGVEAVAARLARRQYAGVCGVNIGKNAATPLQSAMDDYVAALRGASCVADYVAINISSPNTAELRRLQHGALLRDLLCAMQETRATLALETERHIPLLIKLTADLSDAELADAARITIECGMDGLIATNTTVARDGLAGGKTSEEGGLSGAPLLARALHAVRRIRMEVGRDFPIIGVGGIASAVDALAMRAAGADLVQVYTGLVYRGPKLIAEILQAFANE